MRVPESKCPACGEKLDDTTEVAGGDSQPKEGDISLCAECGVVLTFDEELQVRLMSTSEVLALKPEEKRMIAAARRVLAQLPAGQKAKEYELQLKTMLLRARMWLEMHQGQSFKVQFNYPNQTNIVAPISNAVQAHWVSCDEKGLELIKSLWPWDNEKEPTLAMVRAVMDELMNYGKLEKDAL